MFDLQLKSMKILQGYFILTKNHQQQISATLELGLECERKKCESNMLATGPLLCIVSLGHTISYDHGKCILVMFPQQE